MKSIWIDRDNDADYARLKALKITAPYYDIRDPRVTKAYLLDVKSKGFSPGVYAAWNWGTWTGAEFAEWTHEKLKPLHVSSTFPTVHLDIETHDVPWILSCLRRWRELRPTKRTGWTMEAHQAGLFSPADVLQIVQANVDLLPQAYTGSMERMESDRVVLDLVLRGFPANRIWCFYDAAQLGAWWDGCAYTQGRLP